MPLRASRFFLRVKKSTPGMRRVFAWANFEEGDNTGLTCRGGQAKKSATETVALKKF